MKGFAFVGVAFKVIETVVRSANDVVYADDGGGSAEDFIAYPIGK